MRLVDGKPYYIHYDGWCNLGNFDSEEIAKKMVEINSSLRENKYILELERTYSAGSRLTGGCPSYYRIKSFSIVGKEIYKRKQ